MPLRLFAFRAWVVPVTDACPAGIHAAMTFVGRQVVSPFTEMSLSGRMGLHCALQPTRVVRLPVFLAEYGQMLLLVASGAN